MGFEVISMLAAVSAALWCLSIAQDGGRLRWYVAAGCLLGVAVFAYSTGRVAVALLVVALAVAECWGTRDGCAAGWSRLVPVAGRVRGAGRVEPAPTRAR